MKSLRGTSSDVSAPASTTTIVIADDHAVVRSGLHMLLDAEQDFEVVGEAGDVHGAVSCMRDHRPDVLVLDLNMPGPSSLDAIPAMREEMPDTQIVILTMQSDAAFARQALRAGAVGYVLKDAADDELVEAIRHAADGRTYLNPELGARLAVTDSDGKGPSGKLTARETEVLRLIALGYTNAEIAEQLTLSVRTVESHRAHIQHKLDRPSRSELVRYAMANGLVDPEHI